MKKQENKKIEAKTGKQEEKKPEKKFKEKKKHGFALGFVFSLAVAGLLYLFKRDVMISAIVFVSLLIVILIFGALKKKLEVYSRREKIEGVFPDFLQLMSSNLRAGMTIDKAMLLSVREEFSPLDKEILKAGKEITTGKTVESALLEMAKRIGSEKIEKTVLLIISGIKSGGNLAVLLEETSRSIRERDFIEKKAASNVSMYIIFIFVAVAIGAPTLFSLSNILVETMSKLLSGVSNTQMPMASNIPFTFSKVSISPDFIRYFSIGFMVVIDIFAALLLGLVKKGEERDGVKYLLPLIILSIGVFFAVKYFLSGFVSGLF